MGCKAGRMENKWCEVQEAIGIEKQVSVIDGGGVFVLVLCSFFDSAGGQSIIFVSRSDRCHIFPVLQSSSLRS